jgi:hypothetical protein
MGLCSSVSNHPGEEFAWSVIRNIKLQNLTYQELKEIIFKGNIERSNYTIDTGYPISKEESLELIKNFYDENNNKNITFHRTILKFIIEQEFKSFNKEKINSNNILFLIFGFIKHSNRSNVEDSRKERIDNFFATFKNLEETVSNSNYETFKKCFRKYLFYSTKSVTQAILEEAINNNTPFKIQEGLKDLLDKVYIEKFIDDYLTAKLRNYETLNIGSQNNEMTNESFELIFGDSLGITLLYIQELRNDFVQTYSLV